MNLIVLVDINQNLLASKTLADFPSAQQILQEKTNNSIVLFDENSSTIKNLFPHTKQIHFDKTKGGAFPDFLSQVDAKHDCVSNYKHLFEKFSNLEKDRIFIFGDRFSIALLPYVENVFMMRLNSQAGEQPFFDLLNSKDFELLQGGEPQLYEGEQSHLSIFKNLEPTQYTSYTRKSKFVDK